MAHAYYPLPFQHHAYIVMVSNLTGMATVQGLMQEARLRKQTNHIQASESDFYNLNFYGNNESVFILGSNPARWLENLIKAIFFEHKSKIWVT